MSHEERLQIEIAGNDFLLRHHCEGVVDKDEFEHLCENLRALARQWGHGETVSKSLAGLLCGIGLIVSAWHNQPGGDGFDEDLRAKLIEVDSLVLACFYRKPDEGNLALPFE